MANKSFYYSIPALLIGITLIIIVLIESNQNTHSVLIHEHDGTDYHSHEDGEYHSHRNESVISVDPESRLPIVQDHLQSGGYKTAQVTIDNENYFLDIADTNKLRQQGLSYRENLRNGGGMIFIFDQPGQHGIWMKDMNFAIDILWVNKDQTVVHSETNVSPETYPAVFTPPVGADYVVELAAGTWAASSTISW